MNRRVVAFCTAASQIHRESTTFARTAETMVVSSWE